MASILEIDPLESGLFNAASVLGRVSAPSRMPVPLGSILGAAGGAFAEGRQKALVQNEELRDRRSQRENQALIRQQQEEELNLRRKALEDVAEQKRIAFEQQQDQMKKVQNFQSILGGMQESGQQIDEVSILGAGIKSGAFGPRETTEFMSKVMERKAKREQDFDLAQQRAADAKLSREEREAARVEAQRRDVENKEYLLRVAAALKPPPTQNEPLVPVEQPDGSVVYMPRSQAAGQKVPPPRRDARGLPTPAITKLGETGETATNFVRLTETFKDEYGGKRVGLIGDAQNLYGRNVGGGYEDQANWWQDYQFQKNIIRNKLFGSALTANETAEFQKAAIEPGMKSDLIRRNLARQKDAAMRAARKLAGAYEKGGYNAQQIEEALGFSLQELGVSAPKGGGSSSEPEVSQTWEDGQYMYRRLKDGTVQRKKK